jgi:hypothetical protein
MHVDRCRCPALGRTAILEVADQFLLLGVDADDRLARSRKSRLLRRDVRGLRLPVGMIGAGFELFGVTCSA